MIWILPYKVDVPYDRVPFVNWLILAIATLIFIGSQIVIVLWLGEQSVEYALETYKETSDFNDVTADSDEYLYENEEEEELKGYAEYYRKISKHPLAEWILNGWTIKGLIGHMWLHADIFHIFGNMLFLWVFGNAICAKIGNGRFAICYFIFGFTSALAHLVFGGGPMLGASGAINGVVGMFLVLYPENDVDCIFGILIFYFKQFTVSSYWLIIGWFVCDIWGTIQAGDNVAHLAHLGGFAGGVFVGVLMLDRKWVVMEEYEKSILELLGIIKRERPDYFSSQQDAFIDYDEPDQSAQAAASDMGSVPQVNESPSVPMEPMPSTIPFDDGPLPFDDGMGTGREATAVMPVVSFEAKPAKPPAAKVKKKFDGVVRARCTCGKKVKFPAYFVGRKGKCPACGNAIIVPSIENSLPSESKPKQKVIEDKIHFKCSCGKGFVVPRTLSGMMGDCPKCKKKIQIP